METHQRSMQKTLWSMGVGWTGVGKGKYPQICSRRNLSAGFKFYQERDHSWVLFECGYHATRKRVSGMLWDFAFCDSTSSVRINSDVRYMVICQMCWIVMAVFVASFSSSDGDDDKSLEKKLESRLNMRKRLIRTWCSLSSLATIPLECYKYLSVTFIK